MTEYSRKIKEEIARRGLITFAEYMDLALYYPDCGYYMRNELKIGREGDFYTSPTVSVYFGRAIAEQLAEVWLKLGKPDSWQVIEAGGGDGKLSLDVLSWLQAKHQTAFRALHYYLWEKSPVMQQLQKEKLAAFEVGWLDDLQEISGFKGVIFSNELLDAFPVHRLVWQDGIWREGYVQMLNGSLQESWGEVSDPALLEYILLQEEELEDGQVVEVNQAARKWLEEVAKNLRQGLILSIDYGGRDLYTPGRLKGSLRGYYQHQLVDNLLENPGSFDLTAHVDFAYLIWAARQLGLTVSGYRTQARFLFNLGILTMLQDLPEAERLKATLLVKKLILPEGMGSLFKVLALSKNLSSDLKGFE